MRKETLSIPGGGAFVEEAQQLFARGLGSETVIGSRELIYQRGVLTQSECSVFGVSEDHLEECASLGSLIGSKPDRNKHYAESGSRFIAWDRTIEGRPATVGCEHAPSSPVLPYRGSVLRLTIDRTSNNRVVRTAPRPPGVDGR